MKGPFFNERGTVYSPDRLLLATTAYDHAVGALILAGFVALGRYAPRRYRVTATRCLTFATTVGMVDQVHGYTTNSRPYASPTRGARFTELAQAVL